MLTTARIEFSSFRVIYKPSKINLKSMRQVDRRFIIPWTGQKVSLEARLGTTLDQLGANLGQVWHYLVHLGPTRLCFGRVLGVMMAPKNR